MGGILYFCSLPQCLPLMRRHWSNWYIWEKQLSMVSSASSRSLSFRDSLSAGSKLWSLFSHVSIKWGYLLPYKGECKPGDKVRVIIGWCIQKPSLAVSVNYPLIWSVKSCKNLYLSHFFVLYLSCFKIYKKLKIIE